MHEETGNEKKQNLKAIRSLHQQMEVVTKQEMQTSYGSRVET